MKHIKRFSLFIFLTLLLSFCSSDPGTTQPDLPDEGNGPTIAFSVSTQTLGNTRTFGMAIADVDLDGDNDIFISNYLGASRLWFNDGSGNFTQGAQAFGSGASAVHDADLADLNGDSYPDIFVANMETPSRIYFNNGDDSFTVSDQLFGDVGDNPQTIQLADVDGDGDIDAYLYNMSGPNRIWLNDGSGNFTMKDIDYGGSNSNRQVLADLNGDSFPDLYLSFRNQASQIWVNDGAGNFTNSGISLGNDSDNIDFADLDGDGDIDILEANYVSMSVWLNQNNTGTYVPGSTIDEGGFKAKLLDVDLDGDFDLATSNLDLGNKLWLNDGAGSFTLHGTVFGTARVHSLECADLNGDNKIDVVLGLEEGEGGNQIYFNESTP